jgi:endonuclease YncB( thermonuclease family)
LSQLILGKIVNLKNVETEKYGRLLAELYLEDIHLNQWMLYKRYAVKYGGGTKNSPENWKKFHENI